MGIIAMKTKQKNEIVRINLRSLLMQQEGPSVSSLFLLLSVCLNVRAVRLLMRVAGQQARPVWQFAGSAIA
jgi:hypothetical protein